VRLDPASEEPATGFEFVGVGSVTLERPEGPASHGDRISARPSADSAVAKTHLAATTSIRAVGTFWCRAVACSCELRSLTTSGDALSSGESTGCVISARSLHAANAYKPFI
jgi:hypothetical protein